MYCTFLIRNLFIFLILGDWITYLPKSLHKYFTVKQIEEIKMKVIFN